MPDDEVPQAPDIDTQPMDDANFSTADLSQAMGLLGLPRFLARRRAWMDAEAYLLQNPANQTLGEVKWIENGGWGVYGPRGDLLAMVWRQHTEDHSTEKLSNLVHWGFHRYERAKQAEENASIYCLASLNKTVRMFVTYKGADAVLDSPSNRPVLKMSQGEHYGDVELLDAFDDPVAVIHTEGAKLNEVHQVTFQEAEDPFPVAFFAVTLGLEMGFRYGEWRSPFQHVQL